MRKRIAAAIVGGALATSVVASGSALAYGTAFYHQNYALASTNGTTDTIYPRDQVANGYGVYANWYETDGYGNWWYWKMWDGNGSASGGNTHVTTNTVSQFRVCEDDNGTLIGCSAWHS